MSRIEAALFAHNNWARPFHLNTILHTNKMIFSLQLLKYHK